MSETDNPYGLEDPDKPLDEEEGLVFGLNQSLEFQCGSCGAINVVEFDLSGGPNQQLIQDCDTCCRPNTISMSFDEESGTVNLNSSLEG